MTDDAAGPNGEAAEVLEVPRVIVRRGPAETMPPPVAMDDTSEAAFSEHVRDLNSLTWDGVQAAQEASERPPAESHTPVACLAREDGRILQIFGEKTITATCTMFRRTSCLESAFKVNYDLQQLRPLGTYFWLKDRLYRVQSKERAPSAWLACLGCCGPLMVTEPVELTSAPPTVAKVAEEAFKGISGLRGWEYIFGPGYYQVHQELEGAGQQLAAFSTKVSDALVALMTRRPSGLTPSLVVQTFPTVMHDRRSIGIGYGFSPVKEMSTTLFGFTHGSSNPKYQLWAAEELLPKLNEDICLVSESEVQDDWF